MISVEVTSSEYRVAHAMLWDGASNRLVASRLEIAENTVKHHLKSLLLKTRTQDRLHFGVSVWSGRIEVTSPDGKKLLYHLQQWAKKR